MYSSGSGVAISSRHGVGGESRDGWNLSPPLKDVAGGPFIKVKSVALSTDVQTPTEKQIRHRALLDASSLVNKPAALLYNASDSIPLDARFFLIDRITGEQLNATGILALCASEGEDCSFGKGASETELELRQYLSRDSTIRSEALFDATTIEAAGAATANVSVVYSQEIEVEIFSIAIVEKGQTLEEVAANLTLTVAAQ
ncbi:hypothetical protein EMIHUDRAFT_124421, partial [Emiliania huxleyi CCMP1516]|uniref:Uncharacterized protein n=2 Tax=Emiliania huxleyi TaxID=2903 RepID=A0A0D3IR41_EMIH1